MKLKNKKGKFVKKFVHVLVLEAFVGPRPFRQYACHNDGNTSNNSLDNLRWDTCHANHMDKHIHKTMPIGSKHSNAKLTENDVINIRQKVASGELCTVLARKYNVSVSTISYIVLGQTWKHVDGPIMEK